MAEQRLPIVNADDGEWGNILREYLLKEHYNGDANVTPGTSTNGGHQFVTIRAGTASAAPLTLTSGPLRTTPAIGAIEFNADTLYFTQTTGVTRKKVATYDDTGGTQGDIYYRDNNGYLTRLGLGSTSQVLSVQSGLPSWTGLSTAGAVLKADTSTTGMNFVVDEDTMTSNSATKVPTQQSVKAYVDTNKRIDWTVVTGTSQAAVVNHGYISDNSSRVVITLPSGASAGAVLRIAGAGSGGWRLAQNTGDQIIFGGVSTTTGASGYLESTEQHDAVELVKTSSSWLVVSSHGNIEVM